MVSSPPIVTTTWTGYTVVDPAELVKSVEFQDFLKFLRLYRADLIPDEGDVPGPATPPSHAEAENGQNRKR